MRASFAAPFLAGEPRATALLPDHFRRREAWQEEARARSRQAVAPELIAALRAQDAALAPSEARRRNLDALALPGTTAIVSGQQVGLFLGPLYTFYKAASAIVWARAVEAEAGVRCVPIFWLQTEDHDFAEIACCEVPAPPGPALRLALPGGDGRCSVEHVTLAAEVDALVERLAQALAPLPHAAEAMALVRAAYVPGRSLPAAFARMVSAVFADEGLLVLDPRCPEVARLAAPLYQAALTRTAEVDEALIHRGQELERAGLREQVNVRRGSPLIFFHAEGTEGPRHRLARKGDVFHLDGGGSIPLAELVSLAGREPLRFSTSALFRPVVQDALLPVVAYVGGPGELGYLAQSQPLYPLFGVRPALAALRARFRLLDARSVSNLGKLGLTAGEVEVPRLQLLQKLGARAAGSSPSELARRLLGPLPEQISAMAARHPALARAVRRTQATVERGAGKLAARHARLLAEEDTVLQERVDKLQNALYPGGEPQERVHSLPFYAARHGLAALKAAVLAAVRPGESAVQDLSP